MIVYVVTYLGSVVGTYSCVPDAQAAIDALPQALMTSCQLNGETPHGKILLLGPTAAAVPF